MKLTHTSPSAYAVPPGDLAEFGALKEDVRADVRRWLGILSRVAASPQGRTRARHAEGRLAGTSYSSVRDKDIAYCEARDWRVLINRAKQPATNGDRGNLSAALIEHFTMLCLANQRVASAAYDQLVESYKAGHVIPGHGSWRDHHPHRRCCPPDLPPGWSRRTFYRHAPKRESYPALAARQGRSAASDYRLKTCTTRVGLLVGQEYQVDDQEYDVKLNFLAFGSEQSKAMRPLGLDALDVLSAAQVLNGYIPVLWDAEKQKRIMPIERHMPFFILGLLTTCGWREDTGTTVTCELGAAKVAGWLADRVAEATGGKVSFQAGRSMDRRGAYDALFDSAGRGNFRLKAHLESSRVAIRNRMADTLTFPGAVGLDRDHSPLELDGRDRENALLLRARELLGERGELLELTYLEWTQFLHKAAALYRAHNEESRHRLEGWRECGHVVNEWRAALDMPWEDVRVLLDRPLEEQIILQAALDRYGDKLTQVRQMTRWEVWQHGRGALHRLPLHAWPVILGPEHGVERVVQKDEVFAWQDSETSPAPWRYVARVNGHMLRRGEKYLTYHNPYAPERLVVCDAKGSVLGACRSWGGVGRADEAARIEQASVAVAFEREKLDRLARTMAPVSVKALGTRRRNRALVAEAMQSPCNGPALPVQPTDADTVRRERAAAFDAADFADFPVAETQNAPAADNGEGVWPAAVSPATHPADAGPESFSAADFY